MNKKTLGLIAGAVLLVLGLVWVFASPKKAEAIASELGRYQTAAATTTVVFMTPGTATTTLAFPTHDVDSFDLFIQFNASSTASEINWKYQYSNNNIDWIDGSEIVDYAITTATSPTGTATSTLVAKVYSASTLSRWNPNVAGISRLAVETPPVNANFSRVVFSIPVGIGSGNGSLWAEVTTKRDAN